MKFHKVKEVSVLPDLRLSVQFANGTTKIYDAAPLIRRLPAFAALEDEVLFGSVEVNQGGYGIIWNDELDLYCDELWDIGVEVATPFDDLMSFSDVSELWGLSESTLRKVITYGKIVSGVDARKYGKQWVVNLDAMSREYGDPVGERSMGFLAAKRWVRSGEYVHSTLGEKRLLRRRRLSRANSNFCER